MEAQNIFIAHPENSDQVDALKKLAESLKIKFEINEETYSTEFVRKIQKSRDDYKAGKGKSMTVEDFDELWK